MSKTINQEIDEIEDYFDNILRQDSFIKRCKDNPLLDMAICLDKNTTLDRTNRWVDQIDLSVYFPNDPNGYHVHFTDLTKLLAFCYDVLSEIQVFWIDPEKQFIHFVFDLMDITERDGFEDYLNPKHPLYRENQAIHICSWHGTKSRILTRDNLNDLFLV
jgi:hypothetical protein